MPSGPQTQWIGLVLALVLGYMWEKGVGFSAGYEDGEAAGELPADDADEDLGDDLPRSDQTR